MTALDMAIVRLASRQGQKPDRLALTESTQVPAPTPQAQLSQIARQLHWPAPRWLHTDALEPTDLPCLIHHPVQGWGVVHSFNAQQQWVQENWDTTLQAWTEQAHTHLGASVLAKLHCNAPWQLGRSRIWHQILTEFAQEKSALLQAALTGAMINLVALASSLYSMQVYDRVVPTGASQTLWVLTIGVLAATGFELLAKWSRSSLYDHVIDQVDRKLARSVYAKFLAIRLDQMPTRVGALAAQLRGYETVRQFLSSVVTHTLVDAPFALLFTVCLVAIGGWLALIPVVFLGVSVLVGLWSRRRMEALSQGAQQASYLKTGLLVESIEGAEVIKSGQSGWRMLSRWTEASDQSRRDDILEHTDITAPVAGIVKSLKITTIGGVLRNGDELMQISPTEGQMVIEAKVTLAGEKVQISLDNGSTWVDATNTTGTNTFSLATTLTASDTLQARVVDARNNAAPTHNQSYTFDTTAPSSAVDLDSANGTQATSSQTVNAGDWQSGVQVAAGIQAPTSTDIHALKITLGGAGLVGTDHLLLDSTDVGLGADSTGNNLTIGGVSGLSYSYNSTTHVLTLTQAANAAFDPSKVNDILQTLQMRSATMAEATPGDRTVTIAYEDLAGNDSTSATSTVSVIPVAQMNTVSLIASQLSTEVAGAETVTANNTSGSFYFEHNTNTNWNAQNTWAQTKTYDAADGSTQQMHLVHVNSGVESTSLQAGQAATNQAGAYFMGMTDWNKDGIWEYNYSGNSQASQVSQAFFEKNQTDQTPWGNYTQWGNNEPGTDPVETISAVGSNGNWIDWGPNNNADGMAELEYSRVLNLAKTNNHGSIDVASSTAGTAYLVKSTATVTDVASITNLADSQWNSVAVGNSGILSYEDFSRAPKGWTQSNTDLSGTLGRYGNNGHKKQRLAGRCEVAGFYWLTCN